MSLNANVQFEGFTNRLGSINCLVYQIDWGWYYCL